MNSRDLLVSEKVKLTMITIFCGSVLMFRSARTVASRFLSKPQSLATLRVQRLCTFSLHSSFQKRSRVLTASKTWRRTATLSLDEQLIRSYLMESSFLSVDRHRSEFSSRSLAQIDRRPGDDGRVCLCVFSIVFLNGCNSSLGRTFDCARSNLKGVSSIHYLPRHCIPWFHAPHRSEPQWSQNVNSRYVWATNRCGTLILNRFSRN